MLAAIGLGSNLAGTFAAPAENLNAALERLRSLGKVLAASTFIETTPVGYLDQPPFQNGAALLATALPPEDLLDGLLRIERELGRDRSHGIAKGPRTLDLDLLLYGDTVIATDRLTVPHPEMHRRRFVLQPLAEIAPAMRHPVLHATVAELLAGVS